MFDPFAGSGTFGKSALNLDRFFFLTEKEKKYVDRIKENLTQTKIFTDGKFRPKFLNKSEFERLTK